VVEEEHLPKIPHLWFVPLAIWVALYILNLWAWANGFVEIGLVMSSVAGQAFTRLAILMPLLGAVFWVPGVMIRLCRPNARLVEAAFALSLTLPVVQNLVLDLGTVLA